MYCVTRLSLALRSRALTIQAGGKTKAAISLIPPCLAASHSSHLHPIAESIIYDHYLSLFFSSFPFVCTSDAHAQGADAKHMACWHTQHGYVVHTPMLGNHAIPGPRLFFRAGLHINIFHMLFLALGQLLGANSSS